MTSKLENDAEPPVTDETLMLAYAKGDSGAFDKLYHRHKVAVHRFFLRQNTSVAIAEELGHDTWLKVINAREKYQVSALFRTYLFTIARRVLIDFSQKKSSQNEQTFSEIIEPEIEIEDKQQQVNHQYQQKKLRQALNKQIAKLDFEQKQVFLLKQEAGFTIEQIAQITEQHKEKVKSSWRYALQKMREGLSAYVN